MSVVAAPTALDDATIAGKQATKIILDLSHELEVRRRKEILVVATACVKADHIIVYVDANGKREPRLHWKVRRKLDGTGRIVDLAPQVREVRCYARNQLSHAILKRCGAHV